MAKPKNPLLSLGATGTIGDTLTFQKRGQATIARKKPTPTDIYSLAQAYQRWDYRDYAYLWTLESEASKQSYRTRASRYHLTGFSLWMRESLKDLPNLIARWHLDEKSGAIAYDSSKNNNNGIILGASPVAGLIDGAYFFDALNDRISLGAPPALDIINATIEFFITRGAAQPLELFEIRHSGTSDKISFSDPYLANTVTIYQRLANGSTKIYYHAFSIPAGTTHVAVAIEGTVCKVYKNGGYDKTITLLDPLQPGITSAHIGRTHRAGLWRYLGGTLDEFTIYSPGIDATLIKRHSERRYP